MNKKLNDIFIDVLNRDYNEDDYKEFYKYSRIDPNFKTVRDILTFNYCFIPRDSGFFSVFNYFIGLLYYGYIVYPYWNYNVAFRKNHRLRHFCYLDKNIDNCWFEFFEPIRYSIEDDKHFDCKKFRVTQGDNTPKEFKYLDQRRYLFNKDDFKEWRTGVNKIYTKYIKPSAHVQNSVDHICKDFNNGIMIGVHYRHPSHSCEQGCVYFEDYFTKIDNILLQHPDANIFLATDNDLGILVFKDRYSNKIIYRNDVERTSVDNIIDWAYACSTSKPDHLGFINNVGYQVHYDSKSSIKMGHDVLIDALCLSRCNYLVHTVSNIALAVSYINVDIHMISIIKQK